MADGLLGILSDGPELSLGSGFQCTQAQQAQPTSALISKDEV